MTICAGSASKCGSPGRQPDDNGDSRHRVRDTIDRPGRILPLASRAWHRCRNSRSELSRKAGRHIQGHGQRLRRQPRERGEAGQVDRRQATGGCLRHDQPRRAALFARSANRIDWRAKSTTADVDVLRRVNLLLDIDSVRPAGVSATEEEMQAAIELARGIAGELSADAWPTPIIGMSGNGGYLFYRIDLPNDPAATDLCQRVLVGLGERFDTAAAKIDRGTFNASRIAKILGTTARKGSDFKGSESNPARPWRQSWFEPPAGELALVPRELLESVASDPKPAPAIVGPATLTNGHESSNGKVSAIDRCRKYLAKMRDAISGQHGHDATHAAACECYRFGLSDDQALSAMQEFNATKTGGEPWTDRDLEHKLRDARAKVEAAGEFGCRMNDRRHARNGSAPRQLPAKADGKNSAITNAEVIEAADPEGGEPKRTVAPLAIADVLTRIHAATAGWPRRIGSALFTHEPAGLAWLTNEAALFGWLGSRTGIIQWYRALGCPSKGEVFAELQRTVERYEAIEELPHHPPIARHYYACPSPTPGDGSALRGLLERFTPATPIDGDLMLAALLTILWGGSCGSRPAFVFTADAGRGKGKSKAAELLSRVAGGTIDFSANEDMGQIKTRLLSPDALPKRVALLDNVKSHRFSWAELEALITAPAISGRRMYVGEGTRPNTLTWIVTLNGAALSTDMAQRSIIVKIGEPSRSRSWEDDTTAYIEANRQAIIADAIGILSGPPQAELARYSRWATWEAGVLSRLPDPSEAQAIILERQGAVNVEAEEADAIGEFFKSQLERLDYSTDRDVVLIPSAVAARWLGWATGEQRSVIASCRTIKQLCDEKRLARIRASERHGNGRGFVWSGELADIEERMKTDVAERLATKDRQKV